MAAATDGFTAAGIRKPQGKQEQEESQAGYYWQCWATAYQERVHALSPENRIRFWPTTIPDELLLIWIEDVPPTWIHVVSLTSDERASNINVINRRLAESN